MPVRYKSDHPMKKLQKICCQDMVKWLLSLLPYRKKRKWFWFGRVGGGIE